MLLCYAYNIYVSTHLSRYCLKCSCQDEGGKSGPFLSASDYTGGGSTSVLCYISYCWRYVPYLYRALDKMEYLMIIFLISH